MTKSTIEQQLEALELELVTQRLVTRSLVLYLLLSGDQSIHSMVRGMSLASRRTSGEVLPLEGIDPDLQAHASALAEKRGHELIQSLGKLFAAERESELMSSSSNGKRSQGPQSTESWPRNC